MCREQHFHVDVLWGEAAQFHRGLILVPHSAAGDEQRWLVVDDREGGVAMVFGPALLEQALQHALQAVRQEVEGPCYPLWKAAPFELLGYRPPTVKKWLGFIPVPHSARLGDQVGVDGLPVRGEC